MELGLVELIEQLKSELGKLQQSHSHLFAIEGVELELKFGVERSLGAGGEAQWVLFAAKAKGEYKDQQVNTIKLTLKPLGSESSIAKARAHGHVVAQGPPPPPPAGTIIG